MISSLARYVRPDSYERESSSGLSNIPVLDGLRGLAILMVVVGHYWAHANLNGQGIPFALMVGGTRIDMTWLFNTAGIGVRLFFALSAFLLYSGLARKDFEPLKFYKRRALRILPGLGFALLLYVLLVNLFGNSPHAAPLNLKNILVNIFYVQPLLALLGRTNYSIDIIPGTWSLGPELYFYFMLPFLAVLMRKTVLFVLLSGLLFISSLLYRHTIVNQDLIFYLNLLSLMQFFVVGMVVSRLMQSPFSKNIVEASRFTAIIVFVSVLAVYGVYQSNYYFKLHIDYESTISLFCFLLLVSALQKRSPLHTFFHYPWLRTLGLISYSLFLTHIFVAWYPVNSFLFIAGCSGDLYRLLVLLFAGIPLSCILSAYLYLNVEKPFLGHSVDIANAFRCLWKPFAVVASIVIVFFAGVVSAHVISPFSTDYMGQKLFRRAVEVFKDKRSEPFVIWSGAKPGDFLVYSSQDHLQTQIKAHGAGFRILIGKNEASWIAIAAKIPTEKLRLLENKEVTVSAGVITNLDSAVQLGIYDGTRDVSSPYVTTGNETSVSLSTDFVVPNRAQFKINVFPKGRNGTIDITRFYIQVR